MPEDRNRRELLRRLVREKDICVLATAAENQPHCSLMAYVADPDCRKIFMVTHRGTTKYRNLMQNPAVSLLIDTREEHRDKERPQAKALTVTGTVTEVKAGEERIRVQAELMTRHAHLKEFLTHPDARILCVRVSSFLLLDGLTQAYHEDLETGPGEPESRKG